MIELRDVSYRYEDSPRDALSHVSLSIHQGETIAIVGHNGSGKSTLAKLLNGLLLPTAGQVLVAGINTKEEARLLDIRQRVGMVFQNPDNQLVTTVVEEDVAFGPENLGVPPEEIRSRVDQALSAVNMTEFAARAPHMLSGGQKQRIAIAGMLAMKPDVLVLDEATSMLDPEGAGEVLAIVRKLNQEQGMTVVMITQLMEEAAACDRVAVMNQGSVLALGVPRDVFRDEDCLLGAGLEAPAMVRIRNSLIKGGLALRGEPIALSELANSIAQAMGK